MPTRELPSRPNLEQYRKQAKDLLTAWRNNDQRALERVREYTQRAPTLAHAQFVVAREHGFDSWRAFTRHLERITAQISPATVWKAAERAVIAGDVPVLEGLLREHAALFREQSPPASTAGGLAPDYSSNDARTVIARNHEFETWTEFAAFSEAVKRHDSTMARFEAAADATVRGDVGALTRLLRVDPDLIRTRSLRKHHSTLLLYVGPNGIEYFRQRTPKNAPEIARLLLQAGADVNATGDMYGGGATVLGLVATSITPVLAGVLVPLLEVLLDGGAAIEQPTGRPVVNSCLANGRMEAAQFLAQRGARLDLEAAAGVGRLDLTRTFFDTNGSLAEGSTMAQMRDGFTWACEFGHANVIEFLLQRGMDVSARLRHHGQTGLHWAAGGGHTAAVAVLLAQGAAVNARDETWSATPVQWALYGWQHESTPGAGRDRYYTVVSQLVAAGATVRQAWLQDEAVRADRRMLAALGTNDAR